jgi:hypothetical protein
MSREHCREAGDPDVIHMCGLYPFAVEQIDCEGHRSRTFVINIRALHYKNGGSTRVGNGLISGNCECVEVLGHGAAK